MADDKKIDQFPDVGSKLKAPTKKSLFERQKAEAEAKRLREEAETKAAYEDFVKSFDDEDAAPGLGERGDDHNRFGGGGSGFGGPPKRHYSSGQGVPPGGPSGGRGFGGERDRDRGRGSTGPGSLGPPPRGLGTKRNFENYQQPRREDKGLLAFDDYGDGASLSKVLRTSDDEDDRRGVNEEDRAVPKPTLRLASLPPGTSPAVIKALLPATLTVDAVRMQSASGGSYTERKSMSAIVTLAKDTSASDIDAAVNGLQNRYLGFGYYLNLHRHLFFRSYI